MVPVRASNSQGEESMERRGEEGEVWVGGRDRGGREAKERLLESLLVCLRRGVEAETPGLRHGVEAGEGAARRLGRRHSVSTPTRRQRRPETSKGRRKPPAWRGAG